jgi:hypothetical protein
MLAAETMERFIARAVQGFHDESLANQRGAQRVFLVSDIKNASITA